MLVITAGQSGLTCATRHDSAPRVATDATSVCATTRAGESTMSKTTTLASGEVTSGTLPAKPSPPTLFPICLNGCSAEEPHSPAAGVLQLAQKPMCNRDLPVTTSSIPLSPLHTPCSLPLSSHSSRPLKPGPHEAWRHVPSFRNHDGTFLRRSHPNASSGAWRTCSHIQRG